jgi:cyclophilin family peptidyl-prolyl cis-trans isomerase
MMRIVSFLTAAASALAGEGDYVVRLKTNIPGDVVINVTRAWAPLGADHFKTLIQSDYFSSPAAFFRVVPNFVVQFGISGDPATNKKWTTPIKDDPVTQSNVAGSIVYATAGPNTRTTQFFVNYKDNSFLDKQGFAPFGTVVEGMDLLKKVMNPTPRSSGGVSQGSYKSKGQAWIEKRYPGINSITNVAIEDANSMLV